MITFAYMHFLSNDFELNEPTGMHEKIILLKGKSILNLFTFRDEIVLVTITQLINI